MTGDQVTARAAAATRSNVLYLPAIAALGLLGTLVVARELPTSQFVVFAVVLAVRNTAQFLADVGSGSASTRAFARIEQRGDRPGAVRLYGRLLGYRVATAALFLAFALAFPDELRRLVGPDAGDADLLWIVVGIVNLEILAVLGSYVVTGLLRHP